MDTSILFGFVAGIIVSLFLQSSAVVMDADGNTPLHIAVNSSHDVAVHLLMSMRPEWASVKNSKRREPAALANGRD